ncbi:bucky ball-like [Eucyclogobius newberryi]|uniref:bucky ball-like n=1 Tax=Eucyclogobius newberryi TaxID=166745 RepID=UPI003B5B6BC1
MEDGSKAPDAMGSGGQQRTHQRPFFYVQPPSQPYYMYQQWQMNNPYGQYGLPGGFNFGRPCPNPYQYMQYPGFVFPQAPLYPVDYRRMFEPRFPAPHWDNFARHQPPPPPPPGHRETACSEAQTDPSDAITKLIECLDKMQAGECQGADRELDSGVASQSSAMFSPAEEKRGERQTVCHDAGRNESCLETPRSTFSTLAVYNGDSSHRSLDASSPRGCWAGDAEEELPLDSSSMQEESDEKAAEEQVVPIEDVAGIQTDTAATDQNVQTCDVLNEQQKCDEAVDLEEKVASKDLQIDLSFQILKLPFELASEAKGIGRLARDPYCYNYLSMQSTHERLSVLSPSLDELSSRDEMFSTDLDEVELIPRHVYAGGRRLAAEEVDEIWAIGSKRFVCACCGKGLPRGAAARSKGHCTKMYLDEGLDSDDDPRYGRGEQPVRVVVRKHTGARKTQPLPPRLTKSWSRRGPTRDPAEPTDQNQERGDAQEEEGTEKERHRVCPELPQRKVMYHRPRDDEDEPPPPWDRGAAMRDAQC